MNIIARPYGSDLCYCRPDTTWEREDKDLYSPEGVCSWNWAPVLFARISKAGKCIGEKFASRYYDGVNFGMLMYTAANNRETLPIAFSSCADHSSRLPLPLFNPVVLEQAGNTFVLHMNGTVMFSAETSETLKKLVEDTICKASEFISLRIGDLVAVELASPNTLPALKAAEGGISVKGEFCNRATLTFDIIL